jgi:Mycothiol maleylpyruvate isomerase N-terminal domain
VLDLAEAYSETKAHVVDIVRALPEERLRTMVPASPAWNVRDVVAHVTGLAAEVLRRHIPADLDLIGALNDPKKAAVRDRFADGTVEARTGRSLEQLLEEWDAALEELLPMLRGERPFPPAAAFADAVLTTDLAVHA